MYEIVKLRRALEQIRDLIDANYKYGDKEYQVVIIANLALNDENDGGFGLRREGWDD